jgi:serine phosphatase RsbU (regulator of sigma subunit)
MHDQTDLQASQYIIDLFENSKGQSDEVLDSLPGIYSVLNADGIILKGNKTLAEIFKVNFENLLGADLKNLFPDAQKKIFQSQLEKLRGDGCPYVEFKLDILDFAGTPRNYLWSMTPLSTTRREAIGLFSIMGRDVTELTEATVQKTRMQSELATARTVQESLFLAPFARFKGASVAGYYEPANECGGDWWHYGMFNDKLFLWIGDVTGHGVPAALVVSAINSAVSIISEANDADLSPAEALSHLNRIVYLTAKNKLAMTFFIASIDLKTKICTYASAAHEPVLLVPNSIESYTVRDLKVLDTEPGFPLGMSEHCAYVEQTIQLATGDRLLLYTDGLREIVNPAGRKWKNLEFLRTLVPLASTFRGAEDLVTNMKQKVEDYRQGATLEDDATLVALALE